MTFFEFVSNSPRPTQKLAPRHSAHLDPHTDFMQFWDPMNELVHFAASTAPIPGAAASRTRMGMIMTIITTPTCKRGAIG